MAVPSLAQNTGYLTILICLSALHFHKKYTPQTSKLEIKGPVEIRAARKPINAQLKKCVPKKFVFLKVHKSGSSFIASTLRKFAIRNHFSQIFSTPYPTSWFLKSDNFAEKQFSGQHFDSKIMN